ALRVRRDAARIPHRHVLAAQRPLEGPGKVTMGGEAQPPALGVTKPDPLHHRRWWRPIRGSARHAASLPHRVRSLAILMPTAGHDTRSASRSRDQAVLTNPSQALLTSG